MPTLTLKPNWTAFQRNVKNVLCTLGRYFGYIRHLSQKIAFMTTYIKIVKVKELENLIKN